MTWLKLDPAGPAMSEHDFRLLVQEHYLELFLPHAGGFDWDVAAFYRSEAPTYYFSPGATDLLLKSGRFPYEPCDRPEASAVVLQVGTSLACDTSWVELPDEIRPYPKFNQELADDETDYWNDVWGPGGECGPLQDGAAYEDRDTRRG